MTGRIRGSNSSGVVRGAWRFALAALYLIVLAPSLRAQLSTSDHLQDPGFWPTQSADSVDDFVGAATCQPCHKEKAASQKLTPMARTASPAAKAEILRTHPQMNFSALGYRYQVNRSGDDSVFTVSDGTRTLVAKLLWAFGIGKVGQSYLFRRDDGQYYEARVTYFSSLENLGFTPARALEAQTPPGTLEEAMDRPVGQDELGHCFGCHTTGAVIGGKLDEKNLVPGVSCEACHGAGARHSATMVPGLIFNPAKLAPNDSVDFCGACHGTFWDTVLAKIKGPSSARSQPFRLEESKCWGKGDARLTCIGCHDPHRPLQMDPAAYDAVCAKCHISPNAKADASHPAPMCRVGTQNCVSCHMQKVYVPEMHHVFTDHRIRIALQGEPYPE